MDWTRDWKGGSWRGFKVNGPRRETSRAMTGSALDKCSVLGEIKAAKCCSILVPPAMIFCLKTNRFPFGSGYGNLARHGLEEIALGGQHRLWHHPSERLQYGCRI